MSTSTRKHTATSEQQRPASHWQGSRKTALLVRKQIEERWGEAEAANYDPALNCCTFQEWKRRGFSVKRGERALRSYTIVHEFGEQDEDGTGMAQDGGTSYPKGVCLFYHLQVEPMKGKSESSQKGTIHETHVSL